MRRLLSGGAARDLDQSEIDSIFSNRCPACGSTTEGFYRGGEGGFVLKIYCANVDECGAGYNLMGPDPEVNIGGQLFKPSKLGDVQAPEAPPSAASVWTSRLVGAAVGAGIVLGLSHFLPPHLF